MPKCGFNCQFIFTLVITVLASQCLCQSSSNEVTTAKCSQYKKDVFEEVSTFSFLLHGASDMFIKVDNCKRYGGFIVGGMAARPKEFPQMARLGNAPDATNSTNWFCGGTLISEKFVLTAAHCFYALQGEVNRVRLGELDFSNNNDDAQPEDFTVVRNIPHPDYHEPALYNDIGLVELARTVNLNRYKLPACLPITNGDEYSNFQAAGWGTTRFAGASSEQLLKVTLNRYDYDQCRSFTDSSVTSDRLPNGLEERSQLCAGSDKAEDTCSGDSGGPLLAFHPNYPCMYFVVGITSFGIGGCGSPGVPGIYTRVHNYVDWINQNVWVS